MPTLVGGDCTAAVSYQYELVVNDGFVDSVVDTRESVIGRVDLIQILVSERQIEVLDPTMQPLTRWHMGGLDFSPMVLLVALQFLRRALM